MAADPAGILPKFYKAYRWSFVTQPENELDFPQNCGLAIGNLLEEQG
jgi:hypothetical protein